MHVVKKSQRVSKRIKNEDLERKSIETFESEDLKMYASRENIKSIIASSEL